MELLDLWERALGVGVEPNDLSATQMAVRAVLIYLMTLGIIRLAKKRFLGRASAFDVVVGIIIGSIASRAITGNAPMLPSMAACAAIIAVHWLFSTIALRSHSIGALVKGSSYVLAENGRRDDKALRRAHMTERDLEEGLRQQGVEDIGQVKEARLERNGSVSVIKAE